MKATAESIHDACIEMDAGEIVSIDGDLLDELKRRHLIRRPRFEDGQNDEVDYVVSTYGQRLSKLVQKTRDSKG